MTLPINVEFHFKSVCAITWTRWHSVGPFKTERGVKGQEASLLEGSLLEGMFWDSLEAGKVGALYRRPYCTTMYTIAFYSVMLFPLGSGQRHFPTRQ